MRVVGLSSSSSKLSVVADDFAAEDAAAEELEVRLGQDCEFAG